MAEIAEAGEDTRLAASAEADMEVVAVEADLSGDRAIRADLRPVPTIKC